MIFRSWTLLGFCIVLILVAATMPVRADTPTMDELIGHFENVVFGSEFAGVKGATQVQKWVSPVRVSISSLKGTMRQTSDGKRNLKLDRIRPTPPQVDAVRRHLTTLVRLTAVKNEKSDPENGKNANFFIKFVPRLAMGQPFIDPDIDPELLSRLSRSGVCYFVTRTVRTGAMFRALIVVNSELPPDQMDACVLEEMTQAFGLPNDSDVVKPSIFNQLSTDRDLSDTDRLLLKVLYDHRLPAGTPKKDALRIAHEIIREQTGN